MNTATKIDTRLVLYSVALPLVNQIADHLECGTRHYRTKAGGLLSSLDEVVSAILVDNLQQSEMRNDTILQS